MQEKIKIRKAKRLPSNWFKRIRNRKGKLAADRTAKIVINRVKRERDAGLRDLTNRFDKVALDANSLLVTKEEIEEAYREIGESQQIAALKFMKEKVEAFQKLLVQQTDTKTNSDGISVRTVLRPIESVGCYVPGGQAAYPSTLVMTAVPAKVAGVPRVVVCSPPNSKGKVNPLVLVAADICEVNEVYKVGGAQAIAALAYGTETIKSVCKIVGPGSKYVTAAKVRVSTDVAIDMPAGPSEVLVLADESADAQLIAFDMVSQAEHGGDSVAGLITTSDKIAKQVQKAVGNLAALAERGEKISESLTKYGFIITCDSMDEAIILVNQFAAEHLEVMTANAQQIAEKLTAGLILIGPYSPVALSDYGSGTDHVLPTGGFAQAFSGLSAFDFMRRVSIVESSKAGLEKVKDNIRVLAEAENLPNHYKAIEARFEK